MLRLFISLLWRTTWSSSPGCFSVWTPLRDQGTCVLWVIKTTATVLILIWYGAHPICVCSRWASMCSSLCPDEDLWGGSVDQDVRETFPEALLLQCWDSNWDLQNGIPHVLPPGGLSILPSIFNDFILPIYWPIISSGSHIEVKPLLLKWRPD